MHFAIKVDFIDANYQESLFLAAYYENPKQAIWTDQLDDACHWSTLERVVGVKLRLDKELNAKTNVEIIPVTS